MALIYIEGEARPRAVELAGKLKLPLKSQAGDRPLAPDDLKLVVTEFGVGLGFVDKKRGKPYFVDFLSASWRARMADGLARNHIFRRALGRERDEAGASRRLVDATAGFGQDAVMAACLGWSVTAIERSDIVALLLQDGMERARAEEPRARLVLGSVQLVRADSEIWLREGSASPAIDVIYLDPMFDKPKKKAQSPKEMQLLQALFGHAPSPLTALPETLFRLARAAARDRVVVKRPLKAKALAPSPTHSFKGHSIRYDVYIK